MRLGNPALGRPLGILAAAIVMLVVQACTQLDEDAARGLAFAEARCAPCHAIGGRGESPYAPAPPFRTLHTRYPVESLAEALAEGIGVGHRGVTQMPEFVLSVQEIDDLLAYLETLDEP